MTLPCFLELSDGVTVILPESILSENTETIAADIATIWDFDNTEAVLGLNNLKISMPEVIIEHLVGVDTETPVLNIYIHTGVVCLFEGQVLLDKRELYQILGAYKYSVNQHL